MAAVSTGVTSLDRVLGGGLAAGDNVVWVSDRSLRTGSFWRAFLEASPHRDEPPPRLVQLADATARGTPPPHVVVETPHGPRERSPDALESLVVNEETAGQRLVIDGLDDLVTWWGATETVAFYRRVCPRLLDIGTTAYWIGSREMLGSATIDAITRIAQCAFDLREDQLRIAKAEGHPARIQGTLLELGPETDDGPQVLEEQVVGRLGHGLRQLRRERNLTQQQLAALVGVTPAAISQAETGRRGLSLDTVVALCESLGIGVDDLLNAPSRGSHTLVRHDRWAEPGTPGSTRPLTGTAPLFDDPSLPMRSYLVTLGPDDSGTVPFLHKGPELVMVASGLVLVDLGDQTPVLRAGDALMAHREPIRGWTNLRRSQAQLFWVIAG